MAVKLVEQLSDAEILAGKTRKNIGDVTSYSINVEAIPTDANDSSGSVPSMSVKAHSSETKIDKDGNRVNLSGALKTSTLLGRNIVLSDYGMQSGESKFDYQKLSYGRGSFYGKVSSISVSSDEMIDLTIDNVLFKLNCEKTAQAHFGATATKKTAFIYYCSLVGIIVDPNNIDDFFNVPIAYPAWKGNVWDYMKMFCIANKAEISVDSNGKVHLNQIRKKTIPVVERSGVTMNASLLGSARAVEIYDYETSWEKDTLIFEATTTFQVNAGETVTETVDLLASSTTDKIFQPQCVSSIQPIPFKGGIGKSVYVIVDNLNYPVSPEWWKSAGGTVTVKISEDNPMQLDITIHAPNQVNSAYVEPFRLAEYDNDTRPALYICGEGVVINKRLRTAVTGADTELISRDSKATVDNIFMQDVSYHLIQSAAFASGPNVDVSMTIGTSGLEDEINNIAGSRFFYNNGYYRINSASISDSGISINAKPDTIFDDLVSIYSITFLSYNSTLTYNTFSLFNSDWQTKYGANVSFTQFNGDYPAKSFDELGTYYSGMTFSDMSILPLGDTLNNYVN